MSKNRCKSATCARGAYAATLGTGLWRDWAGAATESALFSNNAAHVSAEHRALTAACVQLAVLR